MFFTFYFLHLMKKGGVQMLRIPKLKINFEYEKKEERKTYQNS